MTVRTLFGMTTGAAVMFFFGLLWTILGLAGGKTSPPWAKLALALLALALATWVGVMTLRYAQRAHSAPQPTTEEIADARRTGRSFEWVGLFEGAAILLAVVVLRIARRPQAILPTIAIIVGLHFFPLAALFAAPLYYATGGLGCAIGVAGFFVADTRLRTTVVGIGFGALLWMTSVVVLVEVSMAAS